MLGREGVIKGMEEVIDVLSDTRYNKNFHLLMPEVRINIVYALPDATKSNGVLGFNGRITYIVDEKGEKIPAHHGLKWESSGHMARAVANVRKYRPEINAGMNFRADEKMIKHVKDFCDGNGFTHGCVDRQYEPDSASKIDGQSMPWKIKYLIDTYGKIPDIFYENEGWGKEPLHYAFGTEPVELLKTVLRIADGYNLY